MNINYQFNTTIQQSDTTLYAITPDYSMDVINRQHLFLNHTRQEKTLILEQYLSTVIEILQTFRTFTAHIAEIKRFMQLDKRADDDIRQVLNHLKSQGFLISADEVLAAAQANTAVKPLQEPPLVVVRTAGRVSLFKRFLQSAVDNEFHFNARYHYLVIDDSTAEQAEANAINIAASQLNITHIDKSKQHTILQTLIKQFPDDQQQIEFLLGEHALHSLSPTYGRTWNWGVLLSAGKPVVFLDDDCLLHAYQAPIATKDTVAFGKLSQSVYFLDKSRSLDEQLPRIKLDPIARLAAMLGQTPAQLPCNAGSFAGASYQTVNQVNNARVMMSSQAVAGDPGSASPVWLYYLDGKNAQRFYGQTEADYQRHKSERFMWVGDAQPTFAFGGNYSVVARGLDNRQLLPPTLPIFRNEDALFTNLMHYLYPDGATSHLPWTLAHLPEIERHWRDSDTQKPKDFDIVIAMDTLTAADSSWNKQATASDKLRYLGEQLVGLFNQDKDKVRQWMYQQQQRARAAQLRMLYNAISNNPSAPKYWQADVAAIIAANTQAEQPLICSEQSPKDIASAMRLFGESLSAWEKLWNYAAKHTLI